jgi:hypothetical protein
MIPPCFFVVPQPRAPRSAGCSGGQPSDSTTTSSSNASGGKSEFLSSLTPGPTVAALLSVAAAPLDPAAVAASSSNRFASVDWLENGTFSLCGAIHERPRQDYLQARQRDLAAFRQKQQQPPGSKPPPQSRAPATRVICCSVCDTVLAWATPEPASKMVVLTQFEGRFGAPLQDLRDSVSTSL